MVFRRPASFIFQTNGVFFLLFLSSNGQNPSWLQTLVDENYLQNDAPDPLPDNSPLHVHLDIWVWSIDTVRIINMDFEAVLLIRMTWEDNRLKIPENHKQVSLNRKIADKLWTPTLRFRNCKNCDVIVFNSKLHRITIIDGTLTFQVRLRTKFFCSFNLLKYPMDSQKCRIEIQNIFEETKTLLLDLPPSQYNIMSNGSLPAYEISSIHSGDCTMIVSNRTHSCKYLEVELHRHFSFSIPQIYAPSMLIVILSWISFWLPATSVPPRCGLGATSLFTLAKQYAEVNKSLPPVAYANAADIWMMSCLFIVFCSLIEFCSVHLVLRRQKDKANQASISNAQFITVTTISGLRQKVPTITKKLKVNDGTPRIDQVARLGFPIAFIVFNAIYWSYFLYLESSYNVSEK